MLSGPKRTGKIVRPSEKDSVNTFSENDPRGFPVREGGPSEARLGSPLVSGDASTCNSDIGDACVQRVVEYLRRQFRDALDRADAWKKRAAAQPSKELADEYSRQAHWEEDKAKGYLNQAKSLAQGNG
jgi:hypothetical protein